MQNYSDIVMEHYSKVAKEELDSSLSTMKDAYIRDRETQAIIDVISIQYNLMRRDLSILDVGCGNGYTLSKLIEQFPDFKYKGIEKNEDLRNIASRRFDAEKEIISKGDVLDNLSKQFGKYDVVISQRVIINLLDKNDQTRALDNVKSLVNKDGFLVLLECFESGLNNLNRAREEYEFSAIKPSYHNMYLTEELLEQNMSGFERYSDENIPSENFLSTHYYVTRVLHDVTLQGKPFMRNSHFVKFCSNALPEAIGDYSPIKLYVYRRVN